MDSEIEDDQTAESQSGAQVDFPSLYISTDEVFKYYRLCLQAMNRSLKNEDDEKKNYEYRIIFDEFILLFVFKNRDFLSLCMFEMKKY